MNPTTHADRPPISSQSGADADIVESFSSGSRRVHVANCFHVRPCGDIQDLCGGSFEWVKITFLRQNGQRPPTRDYLVAVDDEMSTGGLFERLLNGLAGFDRAPVWFRDWLVVEREATLIRWFEPLIVPGILQTKADEGVLRRRVGTSAIMAEQCERLLEFGARPNLHLHVVPTSTGVYAGLGGAFTLAKARDFEAAHLDGPLQAQVTGSSDDIDILTRRWEAIRSEALPRSLSLGLIKEMAEAWRT